MKLEELRFDDLGRTCAWFPREGRGPSSMVTMTYFDYCIKAFYLTCQSLEQLEGSKDVINQGQTTIMAVGMWFIAIEAFINSLLRIACCVTQTDFTTFKTLKVTSRLKNLFEILKIQREVFYRSGIHQRLEEFTTFRNEIFHDRTWKGELIFYKTSFCSVPHLANQIDAVQAAIISLEIFNAFRHVYRGLDLMPDIFVQKEDSFGFLKFDVMYEKILRPFFMAAVEKHSLKTELRLMPTLLNVDVSDVAATGEVSIIIKAVQEEDLKVPINQANTSIGSDLFKVAQEMLTQNPDQFCLPTNVLR